MNKVFLSGRVASDIATFGSANSPGAGFTLVTSKPVIKDGKTIKDDNGYTETYDQFHKVKVFGGLARTIAAHKKKGDQLIVVGEIRYSKSERDGTTYYNTDIIADEVQFV